MSCCGVYPTRTVAVVGGGGSPPLGFNDVYLFVCVCDWQMPKIRQGGVWGARLPR